MKKMLSALLFFASLSTAAISPEELLGQYPNLFRAYRGEAENRNIAQHAALLVSDDMRDSDIIQVVAKVAEDQRDDILTRARPLIKRSMIGYAITDMIEAAANVEPGDWPVFLMYTKMLIKDGMEGDQIASTTKALSAVDPTDRENVAQYAAPFMISDIFYIGLGGIIGDIVAIPSAYRELVHHCRTLGDLVRLRQNFEAVGQASHREFAAALMRRINAHQERVLEGEYIRTGLFLSDIEWLIIQSRDEITQRRADRQPRAFNRGRAFEIHNAAKVMVTMGDQKMAVPKAIEHVLKTLERTPMRTAVTEMQTLAATMDNPGGIKPLTKAYGSGEGSYSGEITRLLGVVWPYMKRLPESIQQAWLRLAIDEAYTAYGPNGGLSCSMGVQERLTTTGFLTTLNEDMLDLLASGAFLMDYVFADEVLIDPRLVAISTLAQNVATSQVDMMIEGGRSDLSLEIQEEILANQNPDAKTIEGWIRAAAKAYAEHIKVFQNPAVLASGMTPAEDLYGYPEVQKKMQECAVPLYTDRDYDKFDEWRKRIQRAYVVDSLESDQFLNDGLFQESLFESFLTTRQSSTEIVPDTLLTAQSPTVARALSPTGPDDADEGWFDPRAHRIIS